jgi:hypothetical protein
MEVSIKIRRSAKPASKVAPFADVTLEFTEGKIELKSLSVFTPDGKASWVAAPASKGDRKFFPFFVLSGEIRKRVEVAVLAEFEKQVLLRG